MSIGKRDVARLLESIAMYMELKGENPFKVAAFRKAAVTIDKVENFSQIDDFIKLPGIGKGTATVIDEFMQTGKSEVLEELKKEVPKGLITLLQIPGLGGKKIATLYKELKIENVEDLKEACINGQVQKLPGFGEKSEANILAAIKSFGKQPDRLPIAYMLSVAEKIEQYLSDLVEIEQFSRAGSLRRVKETIKDLDFIIATNEPQIVKEKLLALPNKKKVIASGDTKVSLVIEDEYDVSVDFRIVKLSQFAVALLHFTGSAEHNVRLRQIAKERGEKISEYGVENIETGQVVTFPTEKEFYQHFDLPFIPPELRDDDKGIDEYKPELDIISLEHIRGDLHMHTTWSDGNHTIEEMIEACRKRGYKYLAITDHSKFLRVANGLTEERLLKQREEIKRLNEKYDDITILAGIEMDILPDGTLDFDDDLLEKMDLVIAAIHSSFNQPKDRIMERLTNALKNRYVHIIAHPTGRKIGMRDGYEVDIDLLIQLAAETNTALELNANPNRLDLAAQYLQKAQEAGVKIAINTDSHKIVSLKQMEIGVSIAKKGWIRKQSVINTFDIEELKQFLHKRE